MKRNTWILILILVVVGLLLWNVREHFDDTQDPGTDVQPPPVDDTTYVNTDVYGQSGGSTDPGSYAYGMSSYTNGYHTTVAPDTDSYVPQTNRASMPAAPQIPDNTTSPVSSDSSLGTASVDLSSNVPSTDSTVAYIPEQDVVMDPSTANNLPDQNTAQVAQISYNTGLPPVDTSSTIPQLAPQAPVDMGPPVPVSATPDVMFTSQPSFVPMTAVDNTMPSTLSNPITVSPATPAPAPIIIPPPAPAPAPVPAPAPAPPVVIVNSQPNPTPANPPVSNLAPAASAPTNPPGVAAFTSICNWKPDNTNTLVSSCQWYK